MLGELFMATASRSGFHLLLKHGNTRGLPREFVDRMYDDFDRGTRRAVLRLYRATDVGRVSERLAPVFRSLARPALVIWGRRDPYLPVRFAERQREFFPGAQVLVLDGSGHWPFVDDLATVAGAIAAFLQQRLAASAG